MVDFTVVIPTYNGEHRLPEVFERLCSQMGTDAISWEILVIDNNSSDRTADIVRCLQATFPRPVCYCLERQQGAAYARKRAIQEAQSDLIGFLDDDNLPESDWVASAYQFSLEHPHAGAYASRIQGQFEVEPPPHYQRILPYLALTDRGTRPLQYAPHRNLLPPSAGLVVRKQAWLTSIPAHTVLGGRTTGNMLTGEDLEVLSYIQRSGWEIWYNPAMKVTHKIPTWRLEREYLILFFRGIGLSRYVTRMVKVNPYRRLILTLAYMVNDLRKIVVHLLKYHAQFKTNLAAACELELLIGSLLSPIYLWRNGYLKRP